jgi:Ni/Co efflux regulator RcnB
MRKLNTLLVISMLASSAAIADPPRWSRDQPNSMPRHGREGPGRYREPRENNRPTRTENTQRQNEPRQVEPPQVEPRRVEPRQTEPRPIEPRHHETPPPRDTDREARNTSSNDNRSRWTSGDRDEHGYTRDARPGNYSEHGSRDNSRHDSNRDRRWDSGNNNDRDHHDGRNGRDGENWTHDRDHWRDHRGREWRHDYGWYNDFRGNHFFFNNGRYFARQRFFIGYYSAPWGYSSRLWMQGDILPLPYYEGRYFVDDYLRFDLYDPPYGTRWVRVGYDALLVDTETGEVLDVLHDLFW